MSGAATPGVSVVLPCFNSAARLPDTLRHLAAQRVPEHVPWEVIVVDNASTDATAQVARSEWGRHGSDVPFRIVTQPEPGVVAARDKGFEEARYGFVLFCDDDNWLQEDYVAVAHDVMASRPEVGALGGRGAATSDRPLPDWFDDVGIYYAVGPQGEASGDITEAKGWVYGAGFVIRANAYREIVRDGFVSPLRHLPRGSNDIEVCYLLRMAGHRIWYDERLRFRHYLPAPRLRWRYLVGLTQAAHKSGVFVAPYLWAMSHPEPVAESSVPSSARWLREVPRLAFAWARTSFAAYRRRGEARRDLEIRAVRTKGTLLGWLELRGSYARIARRVLAMRRRLQASGT